MRIFDLAFEALAAVFTYFQVVLRLAVPLAAVVLVFETYSRLTHPQMSGIAGPEGLPAAPEPPAILVMISLVATIALTAVYLNVVIGWHRFLVRGEAPWSVGFKLGGREFRYFYNSIAIGIIALAVVLPCVFVIERLLGGIGAGLLSQAISFFATAAIIAIVLRLSPVLVDVALERKPVGLVQSWKRMTPLAGQIVGVGIIVAVLAMASAGIDRFVVALPIGLFFKAALTATNATAMLFLAGMTTTAAVTLAYLRVMPPPATGKGGTRAVAANE